MVKCVHGRVEEVSGLSNRARVQDDNFLDCDDGSSRSSDDWLVVAKGLLEGNAEWPCVARIEGIYSFGEEGVDFVQEAGSESFWPG